MVVAAISLIGYLSACEQRPPGVVDYNTRYFLEIANRANDRVMVRVYMAGGVHEFWIPSQPMGDRWSSTSGIVALARGERKTFKIAAGMGSRPLSENNGYVRYFQSIAFFAPDAQTPFLRYDYPSVYCDGRDSEILFWRPDMTCSDDRLVYESSTGTTAKLFSESLDRPFYLERDETDTDLARLVITFDPAEIGGSVNPIRRQE